MHASPGEACTRFLLLNTTLVNWKKVLVLLGTLPQQVTSHGSRVTAEAVEDLSAIPPSFFGVVHVLQWDVNGKSLLIRGHGIRRENLQ